VRIQRVLAAATSLAAASILAAACASGARSASGASAIAVYEHRPEAPGRLEMPTGCRLLGEGRPTTVSEVDLATPDTFRAERDRAVRSGANVLVLDEQLISPRSDFDCAAAQPITDCPNTLGGWFRVVPRHYACDASARGELPPVAGHPKS
jgi:hypothetical protein